MEDNEIKLEDIKKEEDALNKETHKSQNIEKQAKIVIITILVFLILVIALFSYDIFKTTVFIRRVANFGEY